MTRLCVVLILSCLSLSACRYWVLYDFAEQFCEFEEFIAIDWQADTEGRQVKIHFNEPILERSILLRYLNAHAFESLNKHIATTNKRYLYEDKFAFAQSYSESDRMAKHFQFTLDYHSLDEHSLLESAYLDSRLSQLFSPALVEPILRSLCSDDYDLSLKRLDMRFTLSSLSKPSLPTKQQLIAVFGQAKEIIVDTDRQTLRYEFDFLKQGKQGNWSPQQKPIFMHFGVDAQGNLNNLHIQYYKYWYWLDVQSLSGRLLVIRSE